MIELFDPMCDVMFRGKPLTKLTPAELMDALCVSLRRVRYLETILPERHSIWMPQAGFVSRDQSRDQKT